MRDGEIFAECVCNRAYRTALLHCLECGRVGLLLGLEGEVVLVEFLHLLFRLLEGLCFAGCAHETNECEKNRNPIKFAK